MVRSRAGAPVLSSSISNAFKAFVEDGEVILQVGRRRSRDPAGGRLDVELTEQIAMPPEMARQLAREIQRAIGDPRPALAAPEDESGTARHQVPLGHSTPSHARLPASAEWARSLHEAVRPLAGVYTRERSLRLRPGEIRANRFLLSVDRDRIRKPPGPRVLHALGRLRFPPKLLPRVQQGLQEALCLHFGFEEGPRGVRFKFYVERAGLGGSDEPVLRHEACKWDPDGAEPSAVTRYWWPGRLDAPGLRAHVEPCVRGHPALPALVDSLLARALDRLPAEEISLLDVEEGDGPRRSVDLNVYDADLRVGDLGEGIRALADAFSLPRPSFEALLGQIEARSLGHLAAGSDRDGAPFVTLYYGAEVCRG